MLESFTPDPPLSPPATVIAAIAVAVIAAAIWRPGWRYFGLYVTVVHELGHAFAALMTGQRLTGIRIHGDQSGTTHSRGRAGWRFVWSGFWGYPAPAVVGAALLWCALNGWQSLALVVGALIILVTLVFIRNVYGACVIIGCFAVAAALALYAEPEWQGYVLIVLALGLLIGAVRDWFTVAAVHVRARTPTSSDAYHLARRTRVPAPVWLFLFAVVIVAALTVSVAAMRPMVEAVAPILG